MLKQSLCLLGRGNTLLHGTTGNVVAGCRQGEHNINTRNLFQLSDGRLLYGFTFWLTGSTHSLHLKVHETVENSENDMVSAGLLPALQLSQGLQPLRMFA